MSETKRGERPPLSSSTRPPALPPNSTVFFFLGGLWGIGAIAHPCPTCVLGTTGLFARGAMEHVDSAKRWMDEKFSLKSGSD